MRTVKEVSKLTGISVRTLHYYDEIGLLKPTKCSDAGYRLYDDQALETLQQILFFREFEMPLKEIKRIMENPNFDQETVLRSQRKMLELKRSRLEGLLHSIDDILKGENQMDFEVFSKKEIEALYESMVGGMNEKQLEILQEQYGDLEAYRQQFVAHAGSRQAQENMAKMVEWYGDRERVKDFLANPVHSEIGQAYCNRIDEIYKKLAEKKDKNIAVSELEVRLIIGEWDYVMKQLSQLEDVKNLMLGVIARQYQTEEKAIQKINREYGDEMAAYIAEAIQAFYG